MEKKITVQTEETKDTFQWGQTMVMMALIMMFLISTLYVLGQSLS